MIPTLPPIISVCICTYKRLEGVAACLQSIGDLQTADFEFEVVVVDNDIHGSARATVCVAALAANLSVRYFVEPQSGVTYARNRCVKEARANLVAFVDDDEVVSCGWLGSLLATMNATKADAVLGPVVPRFEHEVGPWLAHSNVFHRPRFATGTLLHWGDGRTGNVLLRKDLLVACGGFDNRWARSGGEDMCLFMALHYRLNAKLVWCDEAEVVELVPPQRTTLLYVLGRAQHSARTVVRILVLANGRREYFRWFLRGLVALPLHVLGCVAACCVWSRGRAVEQARKAAGDVGKLLAATPDRSRRYGGQSND